MIPGRRLSSAGMLLFTLAGAVEASPPSGPAGWKLGGKVIDLGGIAAEVADVRGLSTEGAVVAQLVKSWATAAPPSSDDDEDAASKPDPYDLALRALGILGEDESLGQPAEGEALGTFDSKTGVIAIDSFLPPAIQDVTAAHEIAHLMQHREFDLDEVYAAGADTDASLAVETLVEGDADFTAYAWSASAQTPSERADVKDTRYPRRFEPGDHGAFIDDLLAFPYVAGVGFVEALHQQGGFAAVDAAFRNPPTTTEQVLHPEKYLDGEEAEDVDGPEPPGGGWSAEFLDDTFGEFDVGELFPPLGQDQAMEVAAGWGGGQLDVYERRDEVAVAVTLAFDTRADAEEACDAVPEWWTALDGARPFDEGVAVKGTSAYMAFDCTGDELRIGVAPQAALAEYFGRVQLVR